MKTIAGNKKNVVIKSLPQSVKLCLGCFLLLCGVELVWCWGFKAMFLEYNLLRKSQKPCEFVEYILNFLCCNIADEAKNMENLDKRVRSSSRFDTLLGKGIEGNS